LGTLGKSKDLYQVWGRLILLSAFTTLKSTHVWKKDLDQLRSPPIIYTSLEKMQQFDVIFKIFGRAIFEVIEVKGPRMLNFEVGSQTFRND
jgi:hypothetical protein